VKKTEKAGGGGGGEKYLIFDSPSPDLRDTKQKRERDRGNLGRIQMERGEIDTSLDRGCQMPEKKSTVQRNRTGA